jgi:hypothetical protein
LIDVTSSAKHFSIERQRFLEPKDNDNIVKLKYHITQELKTIKDLILYYREILVRRKNVLKGKEEDR